jgi:hypothetical protein
MKDNRFIELVNLYIDRQITAEETAELEVEMQANPRRRAVYKQYCQLHTATKQVYGGFRAQSPVSPAGAPAGRVIRAEFARRRPHWIHYAGGLAAAACLAVALVRYNAASHGNELVAETTKAPVQVAVVTPAAPAVEAVASAAVPPSHVATEPSYSELLKAVRQEEQRAFAAGQIQPGRLPSLFDDGVFDARPALPANNQRVFRGKQTPEAQFTAFEFQR